jgi:hypothetical protein
MSALKQLNDLIVGTPELEQRFKAGRLKSAWDVLNEDAETPNHAQRLVWANKIIDDYEADSKKEFRRFLSNVTIQANKNQSTDNDILFVISSFINTYAGV